MSLDPHKLSTSLDTLEEVEKATLRLVTQAIYDYREEAVSIFTEEQDLPGDVGEDITREALDSLGVSRIAVRLFGKIDYKKARYIFHPEYSLRQALFVDSKAEKTTGAATATIQTAQTSMRIRQLRAREIHDIPGGLPAVLDKEGEPYLTTTVFVKYNYETMTERAFERNRLNSVIIAALPNGMLQDHYNPNHKDTIWRAGRNAPSLGEEFRVRIRFDALKAKASWRVQRIQLYPEEHFVWDD